MTYLSSSLVVPAFWESRTWKLSSAASKYSDLHLPTPHTFASASALSFYIRFSVISGLLKTWTNLFAISGWLCVCKSWIHQTRAWIPLIWTVLRFARVATSLLTKHFAISSMSMSLSITPKSFGDLNYSFSTNRVQVTRSKIPHTWKTSWISCNSDSTAATYRMQKW